MNDPNTPGQGYYNCQGFRTNGMEWIDPTNNDLPTRFPFAGDPVAGTGWLLSSVTTCKDMRGGLSSGPFDLAPGDSQEVVAGLVVGVGPDPMGSIIAMRYSDRMAQNLYDMNFELPSPPQPVISVSELDRCIVLTWDNAAESFSQSGYAFEGYNLWQGETAAGPWTRIATLDKANGITGIRDLEYVPILGEMVEHTVQYGTDSGLDFKWIVEEDGLGGGRLVNGRPYYFAVSAYAYGPERSPKVIECNKTAVTAMPHRPFLDTVFHACVGDTLAVVRTAGTGTAHVYPMIVDPASIVPGEYEVRFDADSSWSLWKGELCFFSGKRSASVDENYEVTDGLQVKVGGFTFYAPEDYSGITFVPEAASARFDYTNYAYFGYPANALGSWGTGTEDIALLQCDLEFRWTGEYGPSYTVVSQEVVPVKEGTGSIATFAGARQYAIKDHPMNPHPGSDEYFPIRIPFEAWDIENNIQINTFVYDRSQSLSTSPFYAFYPTNKTYFWTNALPYRETVLDVDNVSTHEGDYNTWSHVLYLSTWEKGDILRVTYRNPMVAGVDIFGFSTNGYEPTRSQETAESRINEINVFPNPYFGQNKLESSSYEQFVTFTNLPEDDCVIRIFSLSGQLVRTLVHDNGTPFERWNLENETGRVIASGMYIIHVRTAYGDRILKFGFVNRQTVYEHL